MAIGAGYVPQVIQMIIASHSAHQRQHTMLNHEGILRPS